MKSFRIIRHPGVVALQRRWPIARSLWPRAVATAEKREETDAPERRKDRQRFKIERPRHGQDST